MAECMVDPETLLEWLESGSGSEREMQLMALEQLCMLLLMSDNIDRCFESCPPRSFLPALCKIFMDMEAGENVAEVAARAITYYLDVSNECTRRITQVPGAVKAFCTRLAAADMQDRTSKDLAEQCIKVLELMCQRETAAVYEAGALECVLGFILQSGQLVHKDTLHSGMSVVTKVCSKVEAGEGGLGSGGVVIDHLSALLDYPDPRVAESVLRCFATLADRYMRKSLDPEPLNADGRLVRQLLTALQSYKGAGEVEARSSASVSVVIGLVGSLCRGSPAVADAILASPLLLPALRSAILQKDERVASDSLRLGDLILTLLCEGRTALARPGYAGGSGSAKAWPEPASANRGDYERTHRQLIDTIRQKDTEGLMEAVENGSVEVDFTDDVGQTLLNWAAAFGTPEMVQFLCEKGADVNRGQRSSSLHYAACFGRPGVAKILLAFGANPDLRDEDGKSPLDKSIHATSL